MTPADTLSELEQSNPLVVTLLFHKSQDEPHQLVFPPLSSICAVWIWWTEWCDHWVIVNMPLPYLMVSITYFGRQEKKKSSASRGLYVRSNLINLIRNKRHKKRRQQRWVLYALKVGCLASWNCSESHQSWPCIGHTVVEESILFGALADRGKTLCRKASRPCICVPVHISICTFVLHNSNTAIAAASSSRVVDISNHRRHKQRLSLLPGPSPSIYPHGLHYKINFNSHSI